MIKRIWRIGVVMASLGLAGIAVAQPGMMGSGYGGAYGPGMMGGEFVPMGPGMMGYGGGGGYQGMMGYGGYGPGMMGGGYGPGMMGGGYGPGACSGSGANNLDLSDAQRKKLDALRAGWLEAQGKLAGRMRDQMIELNQLYMAPTPDIKAIESSYDKLAATRKEMMVKRLEARKTWQDVLTPEQRKKLDSQR